MLLSKYKNIQTHKYSMVKIITVITIILGKQYQNIQLYLSVATKRLCP